ncbi:hypothetical protein [Acetobacter pasteurianus]|uniref:hypothetical protein n=1 Tax=Acetobacter pasteurianus TaxID=438 RepID=UPI0013641898|nr:hypothetical protein [Acetobacter pasteurianus]QHM90377.1 hypothetical protein FCN51_01940 [Acetobacter pasteurianus]
MADKDKKPDLSIIEIALSVLSFGGGLALGLFVIPPALHFAVGDKNPSQNYLTAKSPAHSYSIANKPISDRASSSPEGGNLLSKNDEDMVYMLYSQIDNDLIDDF